MKKHLSIVLSLLLCFLILINTSVSRSYASEVETYKIILSEIQGTLSITFPKNTNVPLYYDENTPITINWLKDNPDFVFTITPSIDGGAYGRSKVGLAGRAIEFAGSTSFSYTSMTTNSMTSFPESSRNSQLLLITGQVETFSITPSGTITGGELPDVNGSGGGNSEDGTHSGTMTDDDKGFFQTIFDGLKEAFQSVGEFIVNGLTTVINGIVTAIEWLWDLLSSILNSILSAIEFVGEAIINAVTTITDYISEKFQSLFDWFEYKKEESEHKKSLWQVVSESLTDLIDKISHATMVPINNFLQSMKSGPIEVLTDIYDFPIIGELLLGAVAVLVVVGFFRLLITI